MLPARHDVVDKQIGATIAGVTKRGIRILNLFIYIIILNYNLNMDKKTFYITTAIHYASGFPHIGHAYEETIADVIAKYKKMIGYDTCLLTGMDEHGQKIAEKAVENNMEPQLWTNFIADQFKILWEKLDINYDYFIRTTEKRHEESVQKIFSELYQKKDIYLGT
ncbi:hypothetical protein FACS189459_0750 [Bacilli bacterium]|nr:hypothetical protein FACS189459_0750 [Bacilli bacterium]